MCFKSLIDTPVKSQSHVAGGGAGIVYDAGGSELFTAHNIAEESKLPAEMRTRLRCKRADGLAVLLNRADDIFDLVTWLAEFKSDGKTSIYDDNQKWDLIKALHNDLANLKK